MTSRASSRMYRDEYGKGDSAVVPMNWSERYYGAGETDLADHARS